MTHTTTVDAHAPERVPGRPDIWIFVLIEGLIFGAYFVSYMVCRMLDPALYLQSQAELSQGYGVLNTLILLVSSWFVASGVQSAREGNHAAALKQVYLTIACGMLFVGSKIFEWSQKVDAGFTFTTNEFFTFYYFMTGIHVVHVLIGFVFLGVAAHRLRSAQHGSQEVIETSATFWHMVDFLWVMIFALLYVMR